MRKAMATSMIGLAFALASTMSAGIELVNAGQRLGYSVDDIACRTGIDSKLLLAIELNDHVRLAERGICAPVCVSMRLRCPGR